MWVENNLEKNTKLLIVQLVIKRDHLQLIVGKSKAINFNFNFQFLLYFTLLSNDMIKKNSSRM